MRFVERTLVVRSAEPDGASAALPRRGQNLARGNARVLRLAKDGRPRGPGFLDDHAYVADAALDLYTATGEAHWVGLARALADSILLHFHDAQTASFYFVPADGERILVRPRDAYDHAVPSATSVACRVLLRLGTLVDPKYAAPAERAVESIAAAAAQNPFGMSSAVALVDRLVRGSTEVVLVGPRTSEATRLLAQEVFRAYVPDLVVAWLDAADPLSIEACRALAEGKPAHGEPVAYVCQGRTCSSPIRDPGELAARLAL
jgi:uncharacterized protein YyaL (SSP411 family)